MSNQALKILLVEDQLSMRMPLKNQLQQHGHEVWEAEDAQAALRQFQAQRPDLILMDVVLPGEDGYWAARQIRLMEGSAFYPTCITFSRAAPRKSPGTRHAPIDTT